MKKLILTFISGILLAMLLVYLCMPSIMVIERKSSLSFDKTIAKISENIEKEGWSLLAVRRVDESIKRQGRDTKVKVALIELCQADYANAIVSDPSAIKVSVMMPCTISVYENADGSVYIANMNTAPLGFMFGGIVKEIMAGKVAPAQKRLLNLSD